MGVGDWVDRWNSLRPWTRFAAASILALSVSAFLPAWRLPGPDPANDSTSTTGIVRDTTLGFPAAEFLERWNEIQLEDGLELVFDVPGFTRERGGTHTYTVSVPDIGVDWAITVTTDPASGLADSITLVAPLDADTDASSFGSIMVIAAVEQISFDDAAAVWNDVLAGLDDGPTDEAVSLSVSTATADYRLALSVTTQFLFQAAP